MRAETNANFECLNSPIALGSQILCHHFDFVTPDDAITHHVRACEEILQIANRVIDRTHYTFSRHIGLQCVSDLETARTGRTLVLLNDSRERWRCDAGHVVAVRRKLQIFGRVGLVGGAVFLAKDCKISPDRPLSIHPNLQCAAHEEGLLCAESPFSNDGALFSAIGGFAAVHMLLAMVAGDLGEFVAEAIESQIGFRGVPSDPVPEAHLKYLQRSGGQPFVEDALNIMMENIEEPLRLSEVAMKVGISSRGLERYFANAFGESPGKVYQNLRLEIGHQLIRNSDMSLQEVALATGYSCRTRFSAVYRKKFKIGPVESRYHRFFGKRHQPAKP